MSSFQNAKLFLVEILHLDKDTLHVHVGLLLFFGAVFVLRWNPRKGGPLLLVMAAAFAGEIWDVRDNLTYGMAIDVGGGVKDLINTTIWPIILTIAARYGKLFRVRP